MATTTVYPENYLLLNQESSKNLMVVVAIDGVPDLLTTGFIYTKIRYGDPDLLFGDPGLVYGGLRRVKNVKPYINLQGSLTISQKIEPEQGRGAISMLTLPFIDKDGYMSKIISPGIVVDEPLGNKFIRIYLGYQNSSFPDDYFTVLRGYITSTVYQPSKVMIQMSDPNAKRKGTICSIDTTKLTSAIDDTTLSIPVISCQSFYEQILGPDGTYDPAVKTYIKINDEFMEYGPGAFNPGFTTITVLSRGARGTIAAPHDIDTEVSNAIQLQDNLVNMALKICLSGWNGPYKTAVPVVSIVDTGDPILGMVPNSIELTATTNAVQDLGLQPGDWVTISGSGAGNNGSYQITQILDALDRQNNLLIVTGGTLNLESPATGVTLNLRSQFDTYPVDAASKLSPVEVDVATHVTIRNFYLGQNENTMRFFINSAQSAKTFIEQMFLPVGAYSITRYGQVSMALTKPPIADQKMIVLDKTNILNPQNMTITRAINNRRYFNEIDYYYDLDDSGVYRNQLNLLDTQSLTNVTISTPLPIQANGLRTDLGASNLINRRGKFLLRRYAKVAFELELNVNWQTISTLEAGDVVNVKDDGTLFLVNFSDGARNLNQQLYEVIERSLDIKSGNGKVKLLSSIGVQVTDRFATISPSSKTVATGSTTTAIKIKESYGAYYPTKEGNKWTPYAGLPIFVHDSSYSIVSPNVTFVGLDPSDDHKLIVSPALPWVPGDDYIVDIAFYPTSTNPNEDALYKVVHAHLDPTLTVTIGSDDFNFFVSGGDAALANVGAYVIVHNASYSILSPECKVSVINIITGQITVETSLGFTPAAGQFVEWIGYKDFGNASGGAYILI